MQASMHLGRLHDATQYRLKRLSDLYKSIDVLPDHERSLKLSYIAIELDNLNICALREFTISTIRKAKTTTGARISVNRSIGPEGEIAAYILSVVNNVRFKRLRNPATLRRIDEQTIRDPKEIEPILIDCAASNLTSLQNALALNSSLFRDIKFVRHFYAHRSKDTFMKASASAATMGLFNLRHPDQILQHVVIGKTHSVLAEWLADAEIFYGLLME